MRRVTWAEQMGAGGWRDRLAAGYYGGPGGVWGASVRHRIGLAAGAVGRWGVRNFGREGTFWRSPWDNMEEADRARA